MGGAPKKDPKKGPKKKASYAGEFGDKKGRKVRKVLRPKTASMTSGTTKQPSKRQVGGGAFSNLLEATRRPPGGHKEGDNFGPAEDFSKDFGPTHKGGKKLKKKQRKRDPFDNPDTVFVKPGESQSYFDLMGDFFETPDIDVFEEVNSATQGPVFPNFPAQDIDRSTRRTPVDFSGINGGGISNYREDSHDEPIFREETERPRRRLRHRLDVGGSLGGGPFGAGSRFEAGPEFEALKENLAGIGEEGPFGHTTPLYQPYAEPLSHYNPLDGAHDGGDVEIFRDSARARRPTSTPLLPEPLPLKQERVPFRAPVEPPRLKAPRRLHLPQMNVGQMLDDHRELSHPVYKSPNYREEIKPFGPSNYREETNTFGPSNYREDIKPLGPLSSIPTPPISKPPKLFDFDPPIDFPELEPFGLRELTERPFTERPVPFRAVRSRPLAPSTQPRFTQSTQPRFSDIPKFDLGRNFDEEFNGPRPFSMAEIRSTPQPPPLLPSPARPFRQRSRSIDHTVPLKFGGGGDGFNSEFFKEHGPHDDGGYGHIPSEFLPAEARGAGGFMGPLLPGEDDLEMSSLGALPRPPIDRPQPPPVLRPSYEFPSVGNFPNLPPPPGFIEATKDMNFDIADVPKLAAKIPYFPPEMVYDAIHGGDESLEMLTHNSLASASPTPGSALRRSDRMLQSPFKSIGDFLGGHNPTRHNPEGFVPKWDSWRHSNRRMDDGLTPFKEVHFDHNFGSAGTKPLGVIPSRSISSYRPSMSSYLADKRIMPSQPPIFSLRSDDLKTTRKIEDSISMDFRKPVRRITYDTKANSAEKLTPFKEVDMEHKFGTNLEKLRSESEGERPFIPSEEDFFSGLDRPNASEFELQRAQMDAVFDGLKKETHILHDPFETPSRPLRGSVATTRPTAPPPQPSMIRTTTAPVYVPKRTYVPPKRLPPPPPPPPQSVVPPRGAPNPKYLEFDPMAFARRRGPDVEEQGRYSMLS